MVPTDVRLRLVRLTPSSTKAQRGVLLLNDNPICVTLELPWRDNFQNISSIPVGAYRIRERTGVYTDGGMDLPRTFEVLEVPDRSGILFHPGNSAADSHGCILLGAEFDVQGTGIWESRKAFGNFLSLLQGVSEGVLTIEDLRKEDIS